MTLPVAIISLSLSPQLLGFFFSQYRQVTMHYNSIRRLNIIAILFIFGLDLTVSLIHVIAQ